MQTLRIAVVDDEPGMRLGAQRVLDELRVSIAEIQEEITFTTVTFSSSEDFLASLAAQKPDILLLDCKLPGIGGMEVLQTLNRQHPDIITIMITAYATLDTAVRATKLGAYDFLAKPFTPDELRATVCKASHNIILTRKARQLVEEKRRIRFQFISVLAHELKSPISAVDGYLDIILNRRAGNDEALYREMVERCKARIDGMRKLVNDLLDLTRIESGVKSRSIEFLDCRAVAAACVEAHKAAADALGVRIELTCDTPLMIQADRSEIEMMLNNLISNAIKYNRQGGNVTVRIGAYDKKGVRIQVCDTGIGMAVDEMKKLFGEFCRIKNEKTRGIPGSGLGLSIVRKLALLYNGDVQAESEVDKGSAFTVTLPDARA